MLILHTTGTIATRVAERAITFLVMQVVVKSNALEALRHILKTSFHGSLPCNYALGIHSIGCKLSLQQLHKFYVVYMNYFFM